MTRFEKPEIGSKVRVTGKPFYPPHIPVGFHNLPTVIEGEVIKSDPRDDPLSFRLATGMPHFPISVVALHSVLDIQYSDGTKVNTVEKAAVKDLVHTVTGSKGDEYVVTKRGNDYSCTCKGFGFNRKCKHVNQVKQLVEG